MIQIDFNKDNDMPIYQQIVDRFTRNIKNGTLSAGYKLPTVRALSDITGASRGTVKHAYDALEHLGLIKKQQGSGTFVCDISENRTSSKKDEALTAIDTLLDRMQELSFSTNDIRIFFELKLRERESMVRDVRIGAVDCSPEALSVIRSQVSDMGHTDVYEYLLQPVLDSPKAFNPGMDLYLTTKTHFELLSPKLSESSELFPVVMSVPSPVVLEFARIPAVTTVGIICSSNRFAQIISKHCELYCTLNQPPDTALFGSDELESLLNSVDQLILPPNHLRFCSSAEQKLLKHHRERTKNKPIIHRYEIERSSLLYLERKIEELYKKNHSLGQEYNQ